MPLDARKGLKTLDIWRTCSGMNSEQEATTGSTENVENGLNTGSNPSPTTTYSNEMVQREATQVLEERHPTARRLGPAGGVAGNDGLTMVT